MASEVDKPPHPTDLRELAIYLDPDPRVFVASRTGIMEAEFRGVHDGRIDLGCCLLDLQPLAGFEVGLTFARRGFTWQRGVESVVVHYRREWAEADERRDA